LIFDRAIEQSQPKTGVYRTHIHQKRDETKTKTNEEDLAGEVRGPVIFCLF
jgi:hypothetical protein